MITPIIYFSSASQLKLILLTSLLISSCRSSWLALWVRLELNIIVFIPILMGDGILISLENRLKYFLVQSVASLWFIFSSFISSIIMTSSLSVIILLAIAIKLGLAPFHGWFVSIITATTFPIIFFLSTVQKFIPLLILRLLPSSYALIIVLVLVTLLSVITIGITQTSLKKLFAVSSLNNVRWLLIGTQINLAVWNLYLIIYMVLLVPLLQVLSSLGNQHLAHRLIISLPNRIKLGLVVLLLSLGGLPPFLGFFNKLMIIKIIMARILLLLLIVCRSLILLYYYLSWSFFILSILPINATPVSHTSSSIIRLGLISQSLGLILLLFSCYY